MTTLQERPVPSSAPTVVALDPADPASLQAALEAAVHAVPEPAVVVDLHGDDVVDPGVLRTLLDLHCQARAAGGELRVRGAGPAVRRAVELAGLGEVLTLEGGPAA